MSDTEKVASPQGYDKNKFWMGVYIALMIFMCVGFYWATTQTEYIWHWNRIPDYFYYTDNIEVKAEIEGEVSSITQKGKDSVVIIEGPDGSEYYNIPGSDLMVGEGDVIYMGDTLGVYQEGQIGLLVKGLLITIEISMIAIVFGIILGLLTGLARISTNPCLKWSAITYIEIIRGTPLLVQIIVAYFVFATIINDLLAKGDLPQIPSMWVGVASLAVFAGAYVAEIVRAGIQSIHKGQMEAARSLGMTKSTAMIKIILPQAFKRILPPLAGQFISLIKDSSLLGVIAITELTKATREAVTTSLMPYELWFVCALMYLVITFTLSMFVQYLEKRTAEA
ncbi:amino acid ABC transporter permease [Pseudodesulfovibrio sp. zrk46]|uniref:amino acid ABC transporter permease n=1 Tax=Pseudodesulfovibrio sp. zrk46 TaxID=2725288 RepID=UPI0014494FF8|nr:amino acid ABC transporter permease [Pseudodesulfovibrio sp. zrk46]QJB58042.1 ABC transporter permease subunit [Pseudodesulfovibrio sp. zrk46]